MPKMKIAAGQGPEKGKVMSTILSTEKELPEDVVDTHLDDIADKTPEKELRSNDAEGGGNEFGERSTYFRPSVTSWKRFKRPTPYKARKIQNVVVTKNGVFKPTLSGASVVHSRTAQLVRKAGVSGYGLPIDDFRLSRSMLSLPVTRL